MLKIAISVTNCFLLPCKGGYLLIDTSYENKYKHFLKALKKHGIDLSEIRYLLITHHHNDHAGFAAELIKNSPAEIIVHREALPHLEKGEIGEGLKPLNWRIKIFMPLLAKLHPHHYPPLTSRRMDHLLSGDDELLLKKIGIDGIILHTPGHSTDSISVLLADGSAIVGDAAMNVFGVAPFPILIDNMQDVYSSWTKLIENGASTIYPAHGKPFKVDKLAEKL
jgi:glyoxylase-like metal-dependent hydrolase (beta-lactamase superfamily II)